VSNLYFNIIISKY